MEIICHEILSFDSLIGRWSFYLTINKQLEGLVNFIIHILSFQFLCDKVCDDGVHPEVRLLNGLFAILGTSLSTLQPVKEDLDLLLILLLSLLGLLLGHLQGLQILTNYSQLFLKIYYFGL